MSKINDSEILAALPISGKRLSHTVAVAKECDDLAELFRLSDEDAEKLHLAALLHDCTKEKKGREQTALCDEFGIPYTEDDLRSPKVFHAITGAAVAARDHGAPEDVCSMIRWHTTGSTCMTLCERLLYLADYIEPTRTWDDCVTLRKVFYDRVRKGKTPLPDILLDTLILSFDMTLRCLLEDGACIHPATVAARNALLAERENKEAN